MLSSNVKTSSELMSVALQAERKTSTVEPRLDHRAIHNKADILAAALHIDRYLLNAMDRVNDEFSGINYLTEQIFKQLEKNKHELNDLVLSGKDSPGEDISRNLEMITSYNEQMENNANTSEARLQRLCACCDRSFSFYDSIVETATDEIVMLAAQKLASLALDRIGLLKQALGEQCGCTE